MTESHLSKLYWDENYADPETMDGVCNAKEHARYLKAIFELEDISIKSIADFGFGMGKLLDEMIRVFNPKLVYGLEPSDFAYQLYVKKRRSWQKKIDFRLDKLDLLNWGQKKQRKFTHFDLGICSSVFQYLSAEEILQILPVLSKRVKFLYFTVPTDKELDIQKNDIGFYDRFANRRSKQEYLNLLSSSFTLVSSRLLESKFYFNEKTTHFTELLFRV